MKHLNIANDLVKIICDFCDSDHSECPYCSVHDQVLNVLNKYDIISNKDNKDVKDNIRTVELDDDGHIKSYWIKGESNPCSCGSNVFQKQNYQGKTYGVCNACKSYLYLYKEYKEFKKFKYINSR